MAIIGALWRPCGGDTWWRGAAHVRRNWQCCIYHISSVQKRNRSCVLKNTDRKLIMKIDNKCFSNLYGQMCRVRFLSSNGCAWPCWTVPTAGHSHKAKASSDQRSGIWYLPTAGHSHISRSFFRSTDPEFDKEKWTQTEKLWSLRATSLTWSLAGDLPWLGQKTGESDKLLMVSNYNVSNNNR